jgi:seryl-tRNA synthetase
MLTINFIRENSKEIISRLKIRNFDAEIIINKVLEIDQNRRNIQKTQDSRQAQLNSYSKEIGILLKDKEDKKASILREKTIMLKEEIKELTTKFNHTQAKLNELLVQIPNIPDRTVPHGRGPENNQLIRSGGRIPKFDHNALAHWDLAKKYNIIDFELGNKITGAAFPVFIGKGAKLQRALINFFLEENEKAGYIEYLPPLLVNEESGFGTGQLPDKEGLMYAVPSDNYYLIPTAEVPVTNMYRDVILDTDDLPVKNTSYTPCFRREAGSYGKDVRGLNRVHQFDKVEIVQIQHPEKSYETLEEMVNHVEHLVNLLELPYRIVRLCGSDLGFASALTYDFEVYAAAQEKWLEVSSVSNFESYQANRLKLRIRESGTKRITLAHTLNGSALALPRIVAALLENNQSEMGIKIPEILTKYTGFNYIS